MKSFFAWAEENKLELPAVSRHLALLPESPGCAAGLSLGKAQVRLPRLGNMRYLLDLKVKSLSEQLEARRGSA